MSVPTPNELRATLVAMIAGATDTPASRWEKRIGPVEVLPLSFHPRCNWRVEVGGTADDRRVIEAAIELAKGEHPYVARDDSPGA